jgi:uncharacterized protein (TIGR02145 family)
MKKLFTLLAFVITITTFAQAPQGFNYQATVRNSSGALIINQNVNFRFNIMLNSQTSIPVYAETHYVLTDDLGQVNLTIGSGTASSGTFSNINWGTGNYYLGIELNTGNGYIAMGTSQLLSVPYALYANSAGNTATNLPIGTNIGDQLHWVWNGTTWTPTAVTESVSGAQIPVITTAVVSTSSVLNNINGNYNVISGGTITSDEGYSITSKGVCWSMNPNPTIADSVTNDGTGASAFSSLLSFIPNTTYYYRAYATNSIGTGYGITYTFPIIQNAIIGTQIWSNTNLDVTTYRDGTTIPQVTDITAWGNLTTGAWCYYNNNTANGAVYGKLYNWYAVAGIHDNDPNTPNKVLAPIGWHVPSDGEWTTLTTYLGGGSVAGGKMKETGYTHWFSPNYGATNESGFTGLPGGYWEFGFNNIGYSGAWWSSSEVDTTMALGCFLIYEDTGAYIYLYDKLNGYSVRLVKD